MLLFLISLLFVCLTAVALIRKINPQGVLLAAVNPLHGAGTNAFKARNDVSICFSHDDFHTVFLSAPVCGAVEF